MADNLERLAGEYMFILAAKFAKFKQKGYLIIFFVTLWIGNVLGLNIFLH